MKKPLPISAKILIATLLVQFLCVAIVGGGLLFSAKENAQMAFDSGRFIKIDANTGQIEGNIAVASPEGATEKALTTKEYRQKRIKELTGQDSPKPLEQTPQTNVMAAIEANPSPQIQATNAVKTPLNLEVPADLVEKNEQYLLPKISTDGKLTPWQYYAKPAPNATDKKPISIIITNLGLNDEITKQAMQLDENVTLAFSPYAPNLAMQIAQARQNGFEAWLNLPLQHENYPIHDYGNLTLLNELTPKQNIKLLHAALNNTNGVVGLIALPDEKYSASGQMVELFEEITMRGLKFALYSNIFTPADYEKNMLTHIEPHINGGNIPSDLNQLFTNIEAKAQNAPHLNISIAAMPLVMQAMKGWIAQLPAKNLILTPLSDYQ